MSLNLASIHDLLDFDHTRQDGARKGRQQEGLQATRGGAAKQGGVSVWRQLLVRDQSGLVDIIPCELISVSYDEQPRFEWRDARAVHP